MYVLFVNEFDVLSASVISFQDLDIVILYLSCLFNDALIGSGDVQSIEAFPFRICEGELLAVQLFKLLPQVIDESCFVGDFDVFVALPLEAFDEILFQVGFGLVTTRPVGLRCVFGYHGFLVCLQDDVVFNQFITSSKTAFIALKSSNCSSSLL